LQYPKVTFTKSWRHLTILGKTAMDLWSDFVFYCPLLNFSKKLLDYLQQHSSCIRAFAWRQSLHDFAGRHQPRVRKEGAFISYAHYLKWYNMLTRVLRALL
jgi:hypothetical protein